MNFKNYLPIGSIVLLENATKKLMIYGVGQTDESSNKTYDYIGVMYPEGNLGNGSQFLFNNADIKEVIFKGFEDEERNAFVEYMQSVIDAQENKAE